MRGVWSLEPRGRAALDWAAEGGRPHVGIAGVQSSRWALLEARVLKPKAWGLKLGAEESSCARLDGRGRPSPGGHCWSLEVRVGIAGGQSSMLALRESRVLKPEAWGLEPWSRAALDWTAEGGRPHVGIAGGQSSTWALLEGRVLKPGAEA